ncbi:MAG: transcriptional regulator [Corynebacteriales bacterium]|nr:transcriptional regulator [Mycobacteriales bacterium]
MAPQLDAARASVVASHPVPGSDPQDSRTRDKVIRLLLENGQLTALELGKHLGLSPAGVRRHLDALSEQGRVTCRDAAVRGPRGRGRPARAFVLTEFGRAAFPHTYDDMAAAALRHIARLGGPDAVAAFADEQVTKLEARCEQALADAGDDAFARAEALAQALSEQGYAATASALASGGQLCQHHCPVAHVAAEFPQLCEAETAAISRLAGSHVQRLATIAHGDGVCTTYIPGPSGVQAHKHEPELLTAKPQRLATGRNSTQEPATTTTSGGTNA